MKTAVSFHYDDAQWRQLEEIVQRAGGAREKFKAQRTAFEKMVHGQKRLIGKWNGRTFGENNFSALMAGAGVAARDLKEALTGLNFPVIFGGNDLLWRRLDGTEDNLPAETEENWRRYRSFCNALEHVRARAAEHKTTPVRYHENGARDMFFAALSKVWRDDIGLPIRASAESYFAQFIEKACQGVCDLPHATAPQTISGVIRKWQKETKRREKTGGK
jgi:hypothetical protein